jgi:hypothetical protein
MTIRLLEPEARIWRDSLIEEIFESGAVSTYEDAWKVYELVLHSPFMYHLKHQVHETATNHAGEGYGNPYRGTAALIHARKQA